MEVELSLAVTDLSLFAHLIQTVGIFLICLLFGGLFSVSPRRYFYFWLKAWLVLFAAMVSLQIYFRAQPQMSWMQYFYFAGGYFFAFYLWVGLYCFTGKRLPKTFKKIAIYLVILGWSLSLMLLNQSFLDRFSLHALVFALSLLPSIWMVWRLELSPDQYWVRYFALISLGVLVILFLGNAFNFFTEKWIGLSAHAIYVAYQSVFDVLVEVLLAFGLIMIAATNVQTKLKLQQKFLQRDRDSMALLAQKDPLTDSFNRHALNKMISGLNQESGLLIMIDINNLKVINDQLGHPTGDKAIQQVAATLKEFSRANDYIFRVGGDEFLLIAMGLNYSSGENRMQKIQEKLLEVPLHSHSLHTIAESFKVTISWGIEEFNQDLKLDQVMQSADQKLYFHKAEHKAAFKM